MIDFLKKLLGGSDDSIQLTEAIKRNAIILDVRSKGEYAGGHVSGSINIPLQQLQSNVDKLNKNKPIIACCASGARSASATSMLKGMGFTEVYNGGSWHSVQQLK